MGNTISQTIQTTIGTTYELTFDAGVNFGGASLIGDLGVSISNDTNVLVNDTITDDGSVVGLDSYTYSFTATESTSTISFSLLSALGGNLDFDVDNVSVRKTAVPANLDEANLKTADYAEILRQIDMLVSDTDYRGINLLADENLDVLFNENGSNKLTSEGIDASSTGLGLSATNFLSKTQLLIAREDIRKAKEIIRRYTSSVQSDLNIIKTRLNFTERTIGTLKSGSDDLVVADQNKKGAELLAMQTRQSLGTTALSLASQSFNSILRLF